jgi:hypothetical protein
VSSRQHGLKEIKREVRAIEAAVPGLGVSAEVDTAACAGVSVQCGDGGTGHITVTDPAGRKGSALVKVTV